MPISAHTPFVSVGDDLEQEAARLGWRVRGGIAVPLVLGFVLGFGATALAQNALSSQVTYWGPVNVNGTNWCGKVQAEVITGSPPGAYRPPNGGAFSHSTTWTGSLCGGNHNAPAGYLGAQVHLVRTDGTLCGSTAWSFNTGAAHEWLSILDLNPSSSCPANGTYHASAHAEHWNPTQINTSSRIGLTARTWASEGGRP